MTIFDCLNDILFTKRGKLLQNVDEEGDFNQYMISRWTSMYSPNMAQLVNNTTNWLYSIFETKQQFYQFTKAIFPRVARKRIHYIKKVKQDDDDEIPNLELLAKKLELSQREIKSYYEFQSRCTTCSDPTSRQS